MKKPLQIIAIGVPLAVAVTILAAAASQIIRKVNDQDVYRARCAALGGEPVRDVRGLPACAKRLVVQP